MARSERELGEAVRRQAGKGQLGPIFYIGAAFFFLSMVLATAFQLERGVLLGGLVVCAAFGKKFLDDSVVRWGALCLGTSFFFIALGLFRNNPGAIRVMTVYIVWPIVYLLFISVLADFRKLVVLYLVVLAAAFVSAAMGILLVLEYAGIFSSGIMVLADMLDATVGIHDSRVEYALPNLATTMFGFGFTAAALLLPTDLTRMPTRVRSFAIATLIVCFICMVISGRRAFVLVVGIVPVSYVVLAKLSRLKTYTFKPFVIAAGMGLVFQITAAQLDLSVASMVTDFVDGFDFSATGLGDVRSAQFSALTQGWFEHPIFGAGLGAAASVIRSTESPWAYELSYVALLFHTGLAGLAIYSAAVIWIFVQAIHFMRVDPRTSMLLMPAMVGLTGFLVANATNPYLTKFDFLWAIFLPVAVINCLRARPGMRAKLGTFG